MDFISDEKLKGKILKNNEVTHKIQGDYFKLEMTNIKTKEHKTIYQIGKYPPLVLPTITPVAEQSVKESRKVWHDCTVGIAKSDWDNATMAKYMVEENQRRLAKEKKEADWQPTMFESTGVTIDGVPIHRFKQSLVTKPVHAEALSLD